MITIPEGKKIFISSRVEHHHSKKSVINTGIKLFNHLPSELKQLHDFKPFRKKLKFLLLNKALYTLTEYFDVSIDKQMVEIKGFLPPIGVLCVCI